MGIKGEYVSSVVTKSDRTKYLSKTLNCTRINQPTRGNVDESNEKENVAMTLDSHFLPPVPFTYFLVIIYLQYLDFSNAWLYVIILHMFHSYNKLYN